MSQRLPAITAKKLLRVLSTHGFEQVRQSGSHVVLKHADGRRTTVPVHSGRDLGKGLLRQVLRDTGLSADDIT